MNEMQGTKQKMRSTRQIITDNARNAARSERRARMGCLEAPGWGWESEVRPQGLIRTP